MIKLILKSKEFAISTNFRYFNNVKSEIYDILTTTQQYEVQSNVSEETFQAFLDYWTIKKVPEFDEYNISEYTELSEEFDLMKDLVQMYQQLTPKITDTKQQFDQNIQDYKQIIDIFCKIPEITDNLKINTYKLNYAFRNKDIEYIKLFINQKVEQNGILYVLNKDSLTAGIIGHTKKDVDIFIPRSIQHQSNEYIVTVIHKYSFENFNKSIKIADDSLLQIIDDESFYGADIKDIKIPTKVKKIGKKAFMKCRRLKTVTFSDNSELEIIDENAFQMSAVKHIFIPDNVKQICDHAFSNALSKIEFSINSKLEKIGNFAFEYSEIQNFSIPPKVNQIGEGSFKMTESLKNIEIMEGNRHFCSIENNNFIVKKSDPKSDIFDVIIFANRDIEEANVPSNIKRIECYSFNLCKNLQKVAFSENSELEFIEKYAFFESGIKTIEIPQKVTSIDKMCFYKAKELKTVEVKKGNRHFLSIDNNKLVVTKSDPKSDNFDVIIFANREIEEINIPSNIKRIECYSFGLCTKLQKVTFSENSELEFIGEYSFLQSALTHVCIPPSVTTIGEKSFKNCDKLQEITFSEKSQLKTIKRKAFLNASSKSSYLKIKIPSSVTSIEEYCFYGCTNLNEVLFANNSKLKFIGEYAFGETGIESITIPKHVSKIDVCAFGYCKNLKKVEFAENSELKIIDNEAFLHCPIESITIPIHVTKIGHFCFKFCKELKTVNFPENSELEILGNSAFLYTQIESITIPPHVKYIFNLNHTIKNVYFSENSELTKFESFCFSDAQIEEITIPSSVQIIEDDCFQLCYSLQKVNFPANSQLHYIGKNAFYYTGITNIVIPPHVTRIKSNTFEMCSNLESVTFSEGSELKVIEKDAFSNSSIQHLYIPSSVIEFQDGWLNDAPQLTDVQISPENKVFKAFDNKIFLKKSKENEMFDVIFFAARNIESLKIPSFVKIIGNGAFAYCSDIKTVEFENNSNLEIICDEAFLESGIENITIPSSVVHICSHVFKNCTNLKKIDFENNSKLKSLGESVFVNSSIESLSIPSSIEKFDEGWCFSTQNLTSITIIQNSIQNICYFNNQFILGKSDLNLQNFDTIIFALRNVKKVTIPHFIEKIEPYAFYHCVELNTIEFEKNSKLKFIGSNSFTQNNSITKIDIPSSVEIIDRSAFQYCDNLKCVTFSQDSNLREIRESAFESISITSFYIPPHATTFRFFDMKIIEIDENTELTELKSFLIQNTEIVMVPSKLKFI